MYAKNCIKIKQNFKLQANKYRSSWRVLYSFILTMEYFTEKNKWKFKEAKKDGM